MQRSPERAGLERAVSKQEVEGREVEMGDGTTRYIGARWCFGSIGLRDVVRKISESDRSSSA